MYNQLKIGETEHGTCAKSQTTEFIFLGQKVQIPENKEKGKERHETQRDENK